MIYVVLDSLELQLERIAIRVAEGGHDVPPDKVGSRRTRSFDQFVWFARHVDECLVFNNSTGEPELVAAAGGPRTPLWQIGKLPVDLQRTMLDAGMRIEDSREQ
jgi:predicted ABC-type ATPase